MPADRLRSQNSKNAHVFCLIHKMDLIATEDARAKVSPQPSLSSRGRRFGIAPRRAAPRFATHWRLHTRVISFTVDYVSDD